MFTFRNRTPRLTVQYAHQKMVLGAPEHDDNFFCQEANNRCTAVLVFNRMQGIQAANAPRSFMFRRARLLYEKALHLLLLLSDSSERCSFLQGLVRATCDIISMAALNNLAQMSFDLMDQKTAGRCLELVIRRATSIETNQYGDINAARMVEHQRDMLLANAKMAILLAASPATAPAA